MNIPRISTGSMYITRVQTGILADFIAQLETNPVEESEPGKKLP